MAVPKQKTSRSRTRNRKAKWMRTESPPAGSCPRCKSTVRPHTVCPTCGFYGGRQVLDVTE